MLTLKIEIEGDRWLDLESALGEFLRLIKDEIIWSLNSNETGKYTFRVTGEEVDET